MCVFLFGVLFCFILFLLLVGCFVVFFQFFICLSLENFLKWLIFADEEITIRDKWTSVQFFPGTAWGNLRTCCSHRDVFFLPQVAVAVIGRLF